MKRVSQTSLATKTLGWVAWWIAVAVSAVGVARFAWADASTTFLWSPTRPSSGTGGTITNDNVPVCTSIVPALNITNATSLSFYVVAGGVAESCSVSIYDAPGTTLIATTGAVSCSASNTPHSITGLTPFSLVGGTKYQVCTCSVNTDGARLLAIFDAGYATLRNALSVPLGFKGSNGCTAGAAPATIGTFTPAQPGAPIVLIGTSTP